VWNCREPLLTCICTEPLSGTEVAERDDEKETEMKKKGEKKGN